ncbi:condensation domain-containing protein, partial [Xanthomonas sp. 1678]|uniref:condensation domain-containing protein n=1 Tax=Xanthomonas sp. 1678 TaxID=3158788 RepID=UPI0034D98723
MGDNFFALGGRSLLALQVINATNRQFGCQLSMVDVFKHPTIGELAGRIGTPAATATVVDVAVAMPPPALAVAPASPLLRVPRHVNEYPASSAQTAMWLVDRMANGSSHYNVPFAITTAADFDVQVARRALLWLIDRHEPLRTVFDDDTGTLVQRVLPMEQVTLMFEHRVLDGAGQDQWRAALASASREQAHHRFDLQRDTMLRGVHLQRDGRGWLLLNAHHIAVDGWSIAVFWTEFAQVCAALAAGREPALPALPLRYIDYTAWQDLYLSSAAAERSRAYWLDHLANLPPRHGLPLLEEGQHSAGSEGESYQWRLPAEVGRKLEALAARQGASSFMLVHAALSVLVARYSGSHDVVIGTPTANRAMSEFEPIVGLFANTLVLRTDCSAEQTLDAYLEQVRRVNLEAFEHQHLPFESLVELLNPPRSEYFAPLFQILLTTDIDGKERASNAGSDGFSEDSQEKVDLACHVALHSDAFHLSLSYRRALFPRWLIEQMAQDLSRIFEQLAAGAVRQLRDIVLSGQAASAALPGTDQATDPQCLHGLFERQVARTPQRIAVRYGDQALDYASLNARANRLAHALVA